MSRNEWRRRLSPRPIFSQEGLRIAGNRLADLLALAIVGTVLAVLLLVAREAAAPLEARRAIDLSWRALPGYAALSLGRGFAAYLLSLAFALAYGTIAARVPRAERLMMPALDVFQSVPVLGFLPGLVLALSHLFPTREAGLECASIAMIFTGQVWNMVFSYYASVRGIPPPLREVALIHRLSGWQTFRLLEAPAAMIGLVWNSMMSMAGGWFFLTVTESFTLRNRDYRLPGIGSYMNEAVARGDWQAMAAAIFAMTLLIVAVDQFLWRPLAVWSQRFKMEEAASGDPPRSWVLDILRRSRLLTAAGRGVDASVARAKSLALSTPVASAAPATAALRAEPMAPLRAVSLAESAAPAKAVPLAAPAAPMKGGGRVDCRLRQAAVVLAGGASLLSLAWGAWRLLEMLHDLPLRATADRAGWLTVAAALGATFLRTAVAVLLGAAWTVPAGICVGLSPVWSRRLQPVLQLLASFPAPMMFPLAAAAWTRIGLPFTYGCVLLAMLGTQWYILFNAIAGAQAIPADLREAARAFGLGTGARWRRLYLPCVFPYLVTGLVTAAGGAWNAAIVSEYVITADGLHIAFGLGSLINQATITGDFSLLAASVATMTGGVIAVNRLVWKPLWRIAELRYRLAS
jgi:NitT/TauT family transport system permease protein